MKKFLLVLGTSFLTHGSVQADLAKTDFKTTYGSDIPVTSPATLTLRLINGNTITTELDSATRWFLLGSDFTTHFMEATFSHNAEEVVFATPFSTFKTGVYCDPFCVDSTTWIMGDVGQFTSVTQVPTGIGTGSNYDALFYTGRASAGMGDVSNEFAGMLTSVDAAPKAASVALFGLGLVGLAIAHRHGRTGTWDKIMFLPTGA